MRENCFEEVLGEIRKFRIEFQVDARCQKRKAFEEPLDVGVRAVDAFDAQPGRDLRELPGEIGAGLPQVLKFPVVVRKESWIHGLDQPFPSRQWHGAGFEIDVSLDVELLGTRLSPDHPLDLQTDSVVSHFGLVDHDVDD